jgi:hypothetical protein
MRRIVKWISVATLGLAMGMVALAAFVVFSNRSSAESAFSKVKVGMTEAEVRQVLSPLGYRSCCFNGGSYRWTIRYSPQPRLWGGDNEWLQVGFIADGSEPSSLNFLVDASSTTDQEAMWEKFFDAILDSGRVSGVGIQSYGPDTRTVWRRIQDEYEYQKHIRGW